jgi:hypothetical protein
MNGFGRGDHVGRAALLAAIGFAGIVLFQVALAVGAPWGHAAWGGAHAHLSAAQRIGSGVAAIIWTAAGLVVLGRARSWSAYRFAIVYRRGAWVLVALLGMSALLNFASQSRWENLVLGPWSLLLAILCAVVARSADRSASRRRGQSVSLPRKRSSAPTA